MDLFSSTSIAIFTIRSGVKIFLSLVREFARTPRVKRGRAKLLFSPFFSLGEEFRSPLPAPFHFSLFHNDPGRSRSNRKRQVSSSINQKSRAEGRRTSLKTTFAGSLAPSLFHPVSWQGSPLPPTKLTNDKSLPLRAGGRIDDFEGYSWQAQAQLSRAAKVAKTICKGDSRGGIRYSNYLGEVSRGRLWRRIERGFSMADAFKFSVFQSWNTVKYVAISCTWRFGFSFCFPFCFGGN